MFDRGESVSDVRQGSPQKRHVLAAGAHPSRALYEKI